MIALKDILVPTDFSECGKAAVRYGHELAEHFGGRDRDAVGHARVVRLRHPGRRHPQAEEAGIEATQPILDRRVVPQIRVRDFLELGVLHARRVPPDRQHAPDIGVEQAFPQDPLTDHAGGAEEDDVQAAILADWRHT